MSDLLNIGASGVRAYQSAISIVSDNIANSGVEGYSKRTTDLTEVSPSTSSITSRQVIDANGVTATGVTRVADDFKEADVRSSSSDLSASDSSIQWLDQIQSALTGNDLSDQLTTFFNAATSVAADPSASAPRTTMLDAAQGAADAFTSTGDALAQVATTLDATAQQSVQTFNGLTASLAKVNEALGNATANTSSSAQLLDQRDQLLEQMSAITNVSVTTDAAGRATVKIGSSTGPTIVQGTSAGSLSYARGDSGAVAYSVHFGGNIVTAQITGGALAGIADGAQRLAEAQTELGQTASTFVDGVNAVQAQGQDLNGNTGAAMFAIGSDPTNVTVTLTDGSGIAAAAPGGGQLDNSNLANLTAFRTTGGTENSVTQITADAASALAAKQTVADAQSSIHDNAVAARDAVSGVSLDSEAVDLLRYQQAYSASSRVIQTAHDMFQSILQIQ